MLIAYVGRVLAGVPLRTVVHLQADNVVDEARHVRLRVVAANARLDVGIRGAQLLVVQVPDGVEGIGTVYSTLNVPQTK